MRSAVTPRAAEVASPPRPACPADTASRKAYPARDRPSDCTASRRSAPNGTVPDAGRQARARPVPASSPGVHSMIATRLEDVLAVEVPGDPQPPPTGNAGKTATHVSQCYCARPSSSRRRSRNDGPPPLTTDLAGCWRGRIRGLNAPAPVPAAVGSRGPADQFDPRDDLR
jgi:hypothetical protein